MGDAHLLGVDDRAQPLVQRLRVHGAPALQLQSIHPLSPADGIALRAEKRGQQHGIGHGDEARGPVIYAELTSWPIGIDRQRLTPVTVAGRWSANGDQRVTVAHDGQGYVPQNQWRPPDITGSALPGIPFVPSVSPGLS
ncbi:hypothetical protein FB451DRAFT_1394968 [Mycena latifolia]|nr:hypothetical protein FB451DRAFT_1394968 [Mycena latifolia]